MTVTEQLASLSHILQNQALTTLFQPIYSLSEQRIFGYEALTRGPSNSPLHAPLTLFSAARQAGRLNDLELASRASACRRFGAQKLNGKLFLNVSPEILLEKNHRPGRTLALLEEVGITPDQVVIELTEQSPIEDFNLLDNALRHYRAMGFSIAIDDLGAGYSSLRLWSELRPDYVKVDRHFIDGIHLDALKREFVGSILKIAHAADAFVITEGIELVEELEVLTEMGVDLVQGYLMGRPTECPPQTLNHPLAGADNSLHGAYEPANLAELLIQSPPISASTFVDEAQQLLQKHRGLNSIAVVDEEQKPVGIVHRQALNEALLKPFGHELLARKPISRLMHEDFLAVDMNQPLQHVSRLLTRRSRQRIDEDFIIQTNGRYVGMGRMLDVLKLITERKVEEARNANPLTQLPGNVPIQQYLTRLLRQSLDATLCYVDIDHFKPFNDMYGYAKGDQVLLCLASFLKARIDPNSEFVGHIGGDDFLLVINHQNWRSRLESLRQTFELYCHRFYQPEHIRQGQFVALNRQGALQRFGLLNLSIGVVQLSAAHAPHYDAGRLAALASEAKQTAKNHPSGLHCLTTLGAQ